MYSLDAEDALLGECFFLAACEHSPILNYRHKELPPLLAQLREEYFGREANRFILRAMKKLWREHQPITPKAVEIMLMENCGDGLIERIVSLLESVAVQALQATQKQNVRDNIAQPSIVPQRLLYSLQNAYNARQPAQPKGKVNLL